MAVQEDRVRGVGAQEPRREAIPVPDTSERADVQASSGVPTASAGASVPVGVTVGPLHSFDAAVLVVAQKGRTHHIAVATPAAAAATAATAAAFAAATAD